jgi:hypothetical protein
VQLGVIRRDADHVKPHQLGGALNEWRVMFGKARRVRLVLHIDAENHENRHFFDHVGPPVMSGCERHDRRTQIAAVYRTYHEHTVDASLFWPPN